MGSTTGYGEDLHLSSRRVVGYLTDFATRHQARSAIFEYIDAFYNRRRRHSSLGYLVH
jgi:transposase InsO family protein